MRVTSFADLQITKFPKGKPANCPTHTLIRERNGVKYDYPDMLRIS